MTTTPHPPHQTRQPGRPSQSRLRRYAAGLAAAGLLSTPLLFTATGSAVADQETPAERCQRQTAEYNAAMDAAWRAAHPGQEPTGNEWPPFVCHDIPTPTPPPGGGNGGAQPAPERTHQYEGFNRPEGQYRQDMDLGGLGGPRTGLADRMNSRGDDTAGAGGAPRASGTARSNVRQVIPWSTTVTDDNGDSRQVRVVDTPDGPAVVADDGTATGEVLTTDTDSGVTSTTRRDGLEGRQLTDPTTNGRADRDDTDDTSSATSTSEAAPAGTSGDHAANGSNGGNGTGGDGDQGGSGGDLPVGPLGAGGLLAGAAGAILADRRRRDGTHRGDITWGNGREQSLILLEGPDSPREHSFDMDVPAGGQMVKNPDGSVDVLDADGNVVEHVKAPWAFDALGRPVETYYEVDNDNGTLVQVVDSDRTSVLPILADPDKQKRGDASAAQGAVAGAQIGALAATDDDTPTGAAAGAQVGALVGNASPEAGADTPPVDSNQNPPQPDPEQRRQDNNNLSIAANSNQNPADVDGDADKEMLGAIDITGREEGVPWKEDLGNGEEAERVIVPGTGRQTVDSRVTGGPNGDNDIRTTANDLNGVDIWSHEEEGGGSYAQTDNDNDRLMTQRFDQAPAAGETATPSVTSEANADNSQGTVVADNPDGSQSYGDYQRTGDNQYEMQVTNPDDTTSGIQSTQRDDAGVSTRVDDQDGSRVSTDGGAPVPLDDAGNDISQNGDPDPNTGRFYDPDSGEWVNGAVLGGVPVHRGNDGKLTDPDGNEVTVGTNSDTGEPEVSVTDPTFGKSDIATTISGAGISTGFGAAEESARRVGSEADDLLRASRWGSRAFTGVGAVAGAEIDRQQGMPAGEAYVSNVLGGAAGLGASALAGAAVVGMTAGAPAVAVVAAGVVAGTVATFVVTKGIQAFWK